MKVSLHYPWFIKIACRLGLLDIRREIGNITSMYMVYMCLHYRATHISIYIYMYIYIYIYHIRVCT